MEMDPNLGLWAGRASTASRTPALLVGIGSGTQRDLVLDQQHDEPGLIAQGMVVWW
jgi:hypothetical protein